METTFISIHNLEDNANILYTSDSIIDILGYTPDEVVNRPAWDFFPFEELPYAQKFHQKRVTTDKAAVLAYCRVKHKDGGWIGCECCFSIVYDVMVVCTSIYKRGLGSEKRAEEAPIVRRMFTSSPQDPRYHMLSHLSHKFAQPAKEQLHEPRAALFLNRFTRTLSIMYATTGIADILGISADEMRGRSFYFCIAEQCLPDAIKCLEQAKGNDSIAYLRFWFRDPRQDDHPAPPDDDSDEEMTTDASVDDDEGGINLRSQSGTSTTSTAEQSSDSAMDVDDDTHTPHQDPSTSRNSSNESTHTPDTHEAIFGTSRPADSSASSLGTSPDHRQPEPVELEAVISCASDGLVVCLRKARPIIPAPTHRPSRPAYENGLFAAPWAPEPVLPPFDARAGAGFAPAFAPSLGPHAARHPVSLPPHAPTAADHSDFMNAIREQAVFAWALTGINGSLAEFGVGRPRGESLPLDGLPVWESDRGEGSESRDSDGGAGSGGNGSAANGSGGSGSVENGNGNWSESGHGDANGWHSGKEMYRSSSSSKSPQDGNPGKHLFGDPGLNRVADKSVGSGGGSSASNGSTPFNGPR